MNSFSPNMLKTFKSCPKKYWFKYVRKISVPQRAVLFEKGKKIHALANYYLQGFDITRLETGLSQNETQVWKNLKQNEYFQKTYVVSEYNLLCKTGNFWIGGRLDAVVKDKNYFYILDYKTGIAPQNPEYDFQTIIYLLCASKKFGENIKFVYIDLKNNKDSVIDFTREDEYEKIITETCKNILDLTTEIKNIQNCNFCEYRKLCDYSTRL